MNTKILTEFQTVYETRSIHRAAKKLFITPQGLGKNIRQLEDELQTVLFERSKQGMVPTESAELLYRRCGEIIRQLSLIDSEIRQLENRGKRLRIGCAYGVFNMMPIRDIFDFMSAHPEIAVEYYEYSNARIREKLLSAELDYGIIVGRESTGSGADVFSQELLDTCPICILVYEGHPFYEEREVSVARLKGERLLSMNEDFWICRETVRRCRECGFEPEIVAKSVDGIVLQKLCSQRIGIAIVPEVVTGELNMEGLRAVPLTEEINWEIYGTCRKDTEEYEAVRKMRDFLKKSRKSGKK